jgi:hypothetical protein
MGATKVAADSLRRRPLAELPRENWIGIIDKHRLGSLPGWLRLSKIARPHIGRSSIRWHPRTIPATDKRFPIYAKRSHRHDAASVVHDAACDYLALRDQRPPFVWWRRCRRREHCSAFIWIKSRHWITSS